MTKTISKEEILLEAAASGIRAMLSTTRGAHVFGANAGVINGGAGLLIITDGQKIFIKVVDPYE